MGSNPVVGSSKIIKSGNQKQLDRLNKITKKINDLEDQIKKLEDESFPQKTKDLIEKIENRVSLKEILPEAFALVREASRRVNNERHFDVQIMGGIILHQGKILK